MKRLSHYATNAVESAKQFDISRACLERQKGLIARGLIATIVCIRIKEYSEIQRAVCRVVVSMIVSTALSGGNAELGGW
jgi:hypothetical protein